mmetsp:Transcript_4949/g.14349  ORF Transcript_4949/g.14349 Transcript_4949/m.14349 type:complete len:208 (-) Transcript_4949:201-824(-)
MVALVACRTGRGLVIGDTNGLAIVVGSVVGTVVGSVLFVVRVGSGSTRSILLLLLLWNQIVVDVARERSGWHGTRPGIADVAQVHLAVGAIGHFPVHSLDNVARVGVGIISAIGLRDAPQPRRRSVCVDNADAVVCALFAGQQQGCNCGFVTLVRRINPPNKGWIVIAREGFGSDRGCYSSNQNRKTSNHFIIFLFLFYFVFGWFLE